MPDGQVQWVDDDRRTVQVVRRGREYQAPFSEVESAARVPGVRVHFDVVRHDGVDDAANVTLRRGSRTHKRQRRFGDLTGARQPGAKTHSASAGRLGVDVATQPMKVVRSWLETLAAGHVDDTLALYAPNAVIHDGGTKIRGRSRLRAFIEEEAPRSFDATDIGVVGSDQLIRVDWPAGVRVGSAAATSEPTTTLVAIERGHIVEEWVGADPDVVEQQQPSFVCVTHGPVSEDQERYVRDRFDHLISGLTRPVLFTRVKLSVLERGRHRERPVSASATVDLDGAVVRAHIGAASVTEAVDELMDRLGRQLKELVDRQHDWPTGQHADPDSWQHGKTVAVRPDHFDRPVEEREIVRHKSFSPDESTVEEAVFDMAALDYDFFLFTELSTGQDALLVRQDDGVLLQLTDPDQNVEVGHTDVTVAGVGAPVLAVRQALQRLDDGAEPFVFFRNEATARGNVVYRRYDGHYGVITPADA